METFLVAEVKRTGLPREQVITELLYQAMLERIPANKKGAHLKSRIRLARRYAKKANGEQMAGARRNVRQ
jgi:hypothetical protein